MGREVEKQQLAVMPKRGEFNGKMERESWTDGQVDSNRKQHGDKGERSKVDVRTHAGDVSERRGLCRWAVMEVLTRAKGCVLKWTWSGQWS